MTAILLNIVMTLLFLAAGAAAMLIAMRLTSHSDAGEGRADGRRGPHPRPRSVMAALQLTAASIATATNSSAR